RVRVEDADRRSYEVPVRVVGDRDALQPLVKVEAGVAGDLPRPEHADGEQGRRAAGAVGDRIDDDLRGRLREGDRGRLDGVAVLVDVQPQVRPGDGDVRVEVDQALLRRARAGGGDLPCVGGNDVAHTVGVDRGDGVVGEDGQLGSADRG